MKKGLIILLFSPVFIFGISTTSASAQIYVSVRPVVPVVVRTPQPSPAHIWVDEEWEPYGNSYRYIGGYWASPPHRDYHWERGYWRRHGNDGEEWDAGIGLGNPILFLIML